MDSPTETKPYSCTVCGQTFKTRLSIPQHMRIHNGIKKYQCVFCERSFVQQSSLSNHIYTHTLEKPHECRHCSRSFGRKCNLDEHILSFHTKIKPTSTCNLCGKKYSRTGLVLHLRIHTGEMPYKCQDCLQRFQRRDFLRKHQEKGQCQRESSNLGTTRSLNKGNKSSVARNASQIPSKEFQEPHEVPPDIIPDTSADLKYECGHCLEKFYSSNALVLHLAHHKTTQHEYLCKSPEKIISSPIRPTYLMWEKKMPILFPVNILSDHDEVMNVQASVVTPPFPQLASVY